MRTNAYLMAELTCPHCQVSAERMVSCERGPQKETVQLRVGDLLPWATTESSQDSPPVGSASLRRGYTECTACGLDFFVDIKVEVGRIVAADADASRPAFKTAPVPGCVRYFPAGTFKPDSPPLDYHVRAWYSKNLSAMGEPSLCDRLAPYPETYRFLWLRSFHRPIVVRVVKCDDGADVHVVELEGDGCHDPGPIAECRVRRISVGQWDKLLYELERCDFWNLSTTDVNLGTDGARWILEGLDISAWKVVDRHSPRGAVRELGLVFLALGLVDPINVY